MATNVTKTSHFTSGAGNPIKFSEIRAAYGGNANNVKASTYLRNTGSNVDWDDESTITTRVPDATENSNVTLNDDWTVNSLRDTISKYVVTQTSTDNEISYISLDNSTWNTNLFKNVPKDFNVEGIIKSDSSSDDALAFSGNLYNLDINVSGAIYGEGGAKNSGGGDALYVNNTYTKSNVDLKINSNGKIWSGGGGGNDGNSGNRGGSLNCYSSSTYTTNGGCGGNTILTMNPVGANQRSRCRGTTYRRGQGWNQYNRTGYHCANVSLYSCRQTNTYGIAGGPGGSKGIGGVGKGFSNLNTSINAAPHKGNAGGRGNTNRCPSTGQTSTGNSGNNGNSGGDWGQSSANTSAGRAIQKKGVKISGQSTNTIKGSINNI
jgi:hypothetical protein